MTKWICCIHLRKNDANRYARFAFPANTICTCTLMHDKFIVTFQVSWQIIGFHFQFLTKLTLTAKTKIVY